VCVHAHAFVLIFVMVKRSAQFTFLLSWTIFLFWFNAYWCNWFTVWLWYWKQQRVGLHYFSIMSFRAQLHGLTCVVI